MKNVIFGNELKQVIIDAINLLCNTVGSTIGPSGNNVIIDGELAPYITNDGVSIAREITSNDKRINSILEIAKEAALKTNENVGDGTTTTLVLLQGIINEGLKLVENGYNAINLRSELIKEIEIINKIIDKIKWSPSKEDLKHIASMSVENKNDGEFI